VHTGNPALIDFIRREIRRSGPVTFAWFMEQALYHPQLGYYSSDRCALGRKGDYFTNVSVGPLFGQLLTAQFVESWVALDRPLDFTIVEQGAHHGDFARDVLRSAQERAPDFFSALHYWIVEPFPVLQARQSETLCDFKETVMWKKSLEDLEPFCGIHFSNELLDAMPVHLVRKASSEATLAASATGTWEERFVDESDDQFGFVTRPIANQKLQNYLETIDGDLPQLYETEVNLAALEWIEILAQKLTQGYALVVDYGYAHEDFYGPDRNKGTLQCRARHRLIESPFSQVGEIDITAHVDWTSLAEEGEANGFRLAGFTDQHHFLTGIVSALLPESFDAGINQGSRRALQTLLHPESLGRAFQLLALTKNVGPHFSLSGFKFARDPRAALGLGLQQPGDSS
jgi:SAM-dependent MidA family methyltransferase